MDHDAEELLGPPLSLQWNEPLTAEDAQLLEIIQGFRHPSNLTYNNGSNTPALSPFFNHFLLTNYDQTQPSNKLPTLATLTRPCSLLPPTTLESRTMTRHKPSNKLPTPATVTHPRPLLHSTTLDPRTITKSRLSNITSLELRQQ